MKFAEFVDVFEVHKNKFQVAMDIYTANAVTGIQQLSYQMNLKYVVPLFLRVSERVQKDAVDEGHLPPPTHTLGSTRSSRSCAAS